MGVKSKTHQINEGVRRKYLTHLLHTWRFWTRIRGETHTEEIFTKNNHRKHMGKLTG